MKDKDEKVEKRDKEVEKIWEFEFILISKNRNIIPLAYHEGKEFESLVSIWLLFKYSFLQPVLPHRISAIASLISDCLFII